MIKLADPTFFNQITSFAQVITNNKEGNNS